MKISVKYGQTLTWGHRGPTDEGWSSECQEWTFEDKQITRICDSDGRDCDGRLSHHAEFHCPLLELNAVPILNWDGYDGTFEPQPIPGMFCPAWQKGKASQRDYTAEAMGY